MALTDFLTQIADSIRSKDGTTEPIPAIDFPQRILDIPSGGVTGYSISQGSFILESDHVLGNSSELIPFKIIHNLGKVPRVFFMFQTEIRSKQSVVGADMFRTLQSTVDSMEDMIVSHIIKINGSTNNANVQWQVYPDEEDKLNAIIIGGGTFSTNLKSYVIRSGCKYNWIAIVEEEKE